MTDLKVIHVDSVTRRASLKLSAKSVTGIDELIQVVILSLLNNPGKDVLDPDQGGGLPSLIGANFSIEDPQEIYAEVQQRVNKTRSEVLAQQVGLNLPKTAKLQSLSVVKIQPGTQIDEIFATLRLISEAGEIADVVV